MSTAQEVSSEHLGWLRSEVARWQADGIIDEAGAAAILQRYRAGGRAPAVRLVTLLGSAFVAAGLISLVASNLDQLSPLVRFIGIVLVWLGALAAAEVLQRRQPVDEEPRGSARLGGARLIAVTAYGATIFQAAQSLQVPAYDPGLLGCWAVGALAYAYACRGIGPLLVGVATLVGWFAWALGERADNGTAFVVGLLVAAVFASAVGAAHGRAGGPYRHFAAPWSVSGALLALAALFGAALPDVGRDGLALPTVGLLGLVAALAVAGLLALRADREGRREIAAVMAMLAAGLVLAAWVPAETPDDLGGAELAHALVGTVVYLAASIWFALLGAARDRPGLTNLATAGLVVFVTVQSFGVFAPLLSGAALFLVLGVILLGGGLAAERGRRRLVEGRGE